MIGKYETAGGRRYVMCMGACIVTTLLMAFKIIDGSVYENVIIYVVGIFVTGNGIQKAVELAVPAGAAKLGKAKSPVNTAEES